MRVLALDPATNFGWALKGEDGYRVFGTWDFSRKRDESWGMSLLRLENKLNEIESMYPITFVAYERPAGMHKSSIISHAKFVGIVESWCERKKIPFRGYSATEIKKFATGKGNAGKLAMIEAACEAYGACGEDVDDNQADALHLLELAFKEFRHVD